MSNKRWEPDYGNQRGGGGRKRSRHVWRKHLYLVLDDWNRGFTIYKIDVETFDSDSDDQQDPRIRVLPQSPALRLETPVGTVFHTGMFFSAVGSKIFIFMNQRCALVYDTETAVLAVGPHAPTQMLCGSGIVVPVGDTLYALTHRFFDKQHSFEAMSWMPTGLDELQNPTEGWSWKTLPVPPPTFSHDHLVTSYAVHPDGCTIFMTADYRHHPGLHLGTYSFNTKDCVWRWHGEWALPFAGEGHFDAELDGWVGLHKDGYICCCQVASRSRILTRIMQLDSQIVEEKLFRKDPERHLRATLNYMGRSRFCLVESVIGEGVDMKYPFGDHDGCVIRLTMFGLKYNRKGELQTTNHRSTQSYVVSRHKDFFSPQAFWM
ncbi:hypothetical protein ACP4OV_026368 [Aristida adscensionis]